MSLLSIYKPFLQLDGRLFFGLLCAYTAILTLLANRFIMTDDLFYLTLGEQLALERIDVLLAEQRRWQRLGYFFAPLLYVLKFTSLACCLITGVFLAGHRISFSQAFKAVMVAETVFVLPAIIKVVYFGFVAEGFTYGEVAAFMPLSLASLFGPDQLEPWQLYFFQLANLFEPLYWFALAAGLASLTDRPFDPTFRLVLASYLPALLLWGVFIVFLQVMAG